MAYKVTNLDLTPVILDDARKEIIPQHRTITEVAILVVPAGVTIKLSFGQNADLITITQPVIFRPNEEESNAGLFFANPVSTPGTTVQLIVSTSATKENTGGREIGSLREIPAAPGFNH
jgi:hypothetical protein